MEQIVINQNDDIVMRLLHFFITVKEYNPIILHGVKDEIWLEKLDENYQIIRIVSGYIHNNEQLDFDIFKTKQIAKKIKRKTFSFNGMNILSIFVNLGDNVDINNYLHLNKIDCAYIKTINDINKYSFVIDEFPNILKENNYKEKGLELFVKITDDIAKKNELENAKNEEIFKQKKPYITIGLIIINVLVFLLGHIDIRILDKMFLPYGLDREYYRLITAAFTHYDVFHLLFNMYALYIVGPQIESFFGRFKYLIIYFFSALTASLLSLTFMQEGGSLGASGAIFGLFGSLLIFGYYYRIYLGNALKSQIIPLIIFNLILGFIEPGIDNAAHIGGLVGGILISMALGVKYKSNKNEKINGYILSAIMLCFLIYTAFIK